MQHVNETWNKLRKKVRSPRTPAWMPVPSDIAPCAHRCEEKLVFAVFGSPVPQASHDFIYHTQMMKKRRNCREMYNSNVKEEDQRISDPIPERNPRDRDLQRVGLAVDNCRKVAKENETNPFRGSCVCRQGRMKLREKVAG